MAEANLEVPVQTGAVDTHCHLFLMGVEPAVAVETAKAAVQVPIPFADREVGARQPAPVVH